MVEILPFPIQFGMRKKKFRKAGTASGAAGATGLGNNGAVKGPTTAIEYDVSYTE